MISAPPTLTITAQLLQHSAPYTQKELLTILYLCRQTVPATDRFPTAILNMPFSASWEKNMLLSIRILRILMQEASDQSLTSEAARLQALHVTDICTISECLKALL